MSKLELLYFTGCPLVSRTRKLIHEVGLTGVVEINLDDLDPSHPYRAYSSPTLLRDGKAVLGARTGFSSCSIVNWGGLGQTLRSVGNL